MTLTEQHKKDVELQIVETVIIALEKHQLRVHHLHELAHYIISKIDSISNREDLISFLTELVEKWPIFKPVLEAEHKKG